MHKPSAILITSDEGLKKEVPALLRDIVGDIKAFSLCKLALKTYKAQKPSLVFLDIESYNRFKIPPSLILRALS